jgi:poly(A) polymerase
MTTTTLTPAAELSAILLADEPSSSLWHAVDSGRLAELVPELPALRMEQDPIHRHKDVLAHTIAVVEKTSPDLVLRLAALFHDIGKPRTRSYEHGGVTFRHHEAVGARMTRKRLAALGYPDDLVAAVAELVRLSGRFKGYAEGWSDSAVRRYARDAGPLLGVLNELVRCDCTTRNRAKEAGLHRRPGVAHQGPRGRRPPRRGAPRSRRHRGHGPPRPAPGAGGRSGARVPARDQTP